MRIKRYLLLLAAATGLVAACQKQDMVMVDMSKAVAPVMHDIDSAGVKNQMIITAENQTSKVTFTWDAADFNVNTQIDYSVEVAVGDGPKAIILSGITKTEGQQTYEAVNQTIYNTLGLKENVLTDVNFYVGATVGSAQTVYSAPVVVKVSVTAAEKQYPKMTIVGSYQGWKPGQPQFVFDFVGDDAKYQGLIDFGADGYDYTKTEFKITGTDWGADNGEHSAPEGEEIEEEAAEITLVSGGGSNITAYRKYRFYHFTFDKTAPKLVKNKAFNSVGVIGSAVGGWDNDIDMAFDVETQKFWVDVTLTAGEIKFRADDDWAINWGVDEAAAANEMKKGVLNGDKNILVPAGNYRIYLNLNNAGEPSFELNADKYGEASTEPEPEPGPSGETVTLYFMPDAEWTAGDVTFAAWVWATGGEGSWYDVIDSDGDGVYEVTIPEELDNIIFASMNGEADWNNKVNQTGDLKVPTDGNNAYDIDSESWVEFGDGSSSEITVYFKPDSAWMDDNITFAAWVWATGGEGSWYDVIDSDGDGVYEVTFPKELDNIIFASMNGETDWNNKVNQTDDLKVPTDGNNVYDAASKSWVASGDEGGSTPDVPGDAVVSEWGLIGVGGDWTNNIKLYVEGDYSVAKGVVFVAGDQFKFRKGESWGVELTYEGLITIDAKLDLIDGTGGKENSSITVAGTYDVYLANDLTCYYVMTPGKTPADAGEAEVVVVDYSDCQMELVGAGVAEQDGTTADTVWNWGNVLLASNEGKPSKENDVFTWTWSNVALTADGWKIRTLNGAASGDVANFDLGDGAVDKTASANVQASPDGNIYVTAGNYNITLVIDAAADTKTVTIVAAE